MTMIAHAFALGSILAAALSLSGCVAGAYTPPTAETSPPHPEREIQKSFDDTWAALVDHTSKAFFGIDRFEKASGLMTLSFSSAEAERFIDCGHMKASSNHPLYPFSADMPYAQYLQTYRSGQLTGKMNLVVKSLGPTRTLVRVNVRYIFSTPPIFEQGIPVQTWTFDSSGQSTIVVAKAIQRTKDTRTCRPTFAAELEILNALSK